MCETEISISGTWNKTLFVFIYFFFSGVAVRDLLDLNRNDVDLWEHRESLHLFWVESGFKHSLTFSKDNDPVTLLLRHNDCEI